MRPRPWRVRGTPRPDAAAQQDDRLELIRTHLDWLLAVPRQERSEERLDPVHARTVLDAEPRPTAPRSAIAPSPWRVTAGGTDGHTPPSVTAHGLGRHRQTYIRRHPEQSLLRSIVAEHLETLLAAARRRGGGDGVPAFRGAGATGVPHLRGVP